MNVMGGGGGIQLYLRYVLKRKECVTCSIESRYLLVKIELNCHTITKCISISTTQKWSSLSDFLHNFHKSPFCKPAVGVPYTKESKNTLNYFRRDFTHVVYHTEGVCQSSRPS